MGIFAKWRDRCAFIRFLVNAQKTPWYPMLFAVLSIISGTHDHTVYVPVMWVLLSFVLFSALFTDDNKVFLVPLIMLYYSIGIDNDPSVFLKTNRDILSLLDPGALEQIIIVCVLAVILTLARLIADGTVGRAFKRRRLFTVSIVAMDVAFLTNGLFSPVYDTVNLLYGGLMVIGFTVAYFLVSGILENSDDAISYACYCMVSTAYVAFLQILHTVILLHEKGKLFIIYDASIFGKEIIRLNRDAFILGWGVSTMIAAVFVLGIPAAMYLARNKKYPLFFLISSILFTSGTILINSRAAMAVSLVALPVCIIACCINGKNRIRIRIYTTLCFLLSAAVITVMHFTGAPISSMIDKLSDILRINMGVGEARNGLWQNGFEDFLSSPAFGVGFNDGGFSEELKSSNIFSNMYHCIFVQIPGSMGIIGCIAFLIHIVFLSTALFKRFSINKLLLMLVPLMIIGMSLVDNFFFYPHFQIFYGIFLALAEKEDASSPKSNLVSVTAAC